MAQHPRRRLTNIRVKEVSLVDEAANLRRFIVVKRKGGPDMAGKKNADLLKPDDDSNVLKLSAEVKESLKAQGTEAVEKIQETLKKVEEIEVSKDAGDEVPGELIEEFDAATKLLPQFAGEGGDEPDEDFGLAKAAEEIKKAGKKISSDRLKKISDAASILSKLLEELGEGGSAASNANSHEGGKGMATEKTEETKKERSPDVAFKLAEAEVIKTREALTEAEEGADKEAITKAKGAFDTADAEFKVAKEAADKATTEAEVKKAQEEADAAAEKLRKAKGETAAPTGENAEVLKAIVAGQEKINEELKKSRDKNEELEKKLADVGAVSQPSNGADTDGDAAGGKGGGDQDVDKAKDPKFWAGVI